MSDIKSWSTTASSNNSASPDGWPEGMNPSGVNDSARENMAAIRRWYEDVAWTDMGHTPVFVTTTSFKVSGVDVTSYYTANRRMRFTDASTLYGYVVSSSFSTDTTVTVALDSGVLSASLTAVEVSIFQDGASTPIPRNFTANMITSDLTGTVTGNADNVTIPGAVENNIATFNASEGLKDSGFPIGGSVIQVDTYGPSDTLATIPTGATHAYIEMWGAGGSGGTEDENTQGSAGGQGGGFIGLDVPVLFLSTDGAFSISVGAGGVARSGLDQAGAAGGDTSITFENYRGAATTKTVIAHGGAGGTTNLTPGGSAGVTTNTNTAGVIYAWQNESAGYIQTHNSALTARTWAGGQGGWGVENTNFNGATSEFGGDGGRGAGVSANAPGSGTVPGGGGGGGHDNLPSGAGADGQIRIVWYKSA